jgi:hypothetical protein
MRILGNIFIIILFTFKFIYKKKLDKGREVVVTLYCSAESMQVEQEFVDFRRLILFF